MFNDFIKKLRSKSASEKNRIAIFISGAITLFFVLIWFFLFNQPKNDKLVKNRSGSEDFKPLFLIFKNIEEGFGDIKQNTKDYKASISEISSQESIEKELTVE